MAISRKHHVGNYTVVDNGFIRDSQLTYKAKGLLLLLLSLPDNWRFTETWLASQSADKLTAVKSGLKELEQCGYLKRSRERTSGKLGDAIYDIYEAPMCDFPTLVNPTLEYHTQINTDSISITNKNINTNNTNRAIEEIVSYLNERAGKKYRASSKRTTSLINARIHEGYSVADFKKVIDNKVTDWKNRKDMEQYLRPETLFGPKFEGYLNENKGTRGVNRLGDRT